MASGTSARSKLQFPTSIHGEDCLDIDANDQSNTGVEGVGIIPLDCDTEENVPTQIMDGRSRDVDEDPELNITYSENNCHHGNMINALTGRRLVDIGYLFRSIQAERHEGGFGCTFMDMDLIKKELPKGFMSTWTFKCRMCLKVSKIKSEDNSKVGYMAVNDAAVHGIVATGGGYSQLEQFSSALDMPCMDNKTYIRHFHKVSVAIHDAAWQSMEKAGQMEAEIARREGNVDTKGNPMCTVIGDGQWCKRSYKTKYDSLSGVASIVGFRTGQVLYIGVRNRYCCICDRARSRKEDSPEHICFMNWSKSATSMEADIIAEGFAKSLLMHGLIYDKLIGDGDSSVYSRLCITMPYGEDHLVQKIECKSHLKRNFCTKLYELAKRTKSGFPVHLRHALDKNVRRLRTAVSTASMKRKDQVAPFNVRMMELKKDLANGPYHVFGSHDGCHERGYFCKGPKDNEVDLVPELVQCGLMLEIDSAVKWCLTRHAASLLLDVSNNPCEHYNSHVNKFLGSRRVNYALRGAYQTRCDAGIVSFNNPGEYLRNVHKAMVGESPGKYTKKHVERDIKKLAQSRSRRTENPHLRHRKSKHSAPGMDEDYGLQEADNPVQLTAEEFDKKKKDLLASLTLSDATRKELERDTVLQSKSQLWFKAKRKRLTASWFGRVCKMRPTTSCRGIVSAMLYKQVKTKAMEHGVINEPVAKETMAERHGIVSTECGFFIDEEHPYIGASPDGLVGEDAIIEVKCPVSADPYQTPEEAIADKKIPYCDLVDSKLLLKPTSNYFYQIQGQLHVTKRKYCYFVQYTKNWLAYEMIERDDDFWKNRMIPHLERFYMECLLPELVESQFAKRLVIGDIKDPKYITDAISASTEKKTLELASREKRLKDALSKKKKSTSGPKSTSVNTAKSEVKPAQSVAT